MPFSSNLTLEPLPSIVCAPSATNNDSIFSIPKLLEQEVKKQQAVWCGEIYSCFEVTKVFAMVQSNIDITILISNVYGITGWCCRSDAA